MEFEPPRSLSPSKMSSFSNSALAFRFTAIERLPDPATVPTVTGTLVHRALERLFWNHPRGARKRSAAAAELSTAWDDLQDDDDFRSLGLDADAAMGLRATAEQLVANYFLLEDPDDVTVVGVELTLEARVGDVRLRGILDRLDRTPDGDLVVVDYKTGRAPAPAYLQARLAGVQTYALLCQEVLGRRPVEVRLLHLKEPTVIDAEPTDQGLRGQKTRTLAIWRAVERACTDGDFRPKTGPLCRFCRFRDYCPAYGGDPDLAAANLGVGERRGGVTTPEYVSADGTARGFLAVVAELDDRVDRLMEPLRGRPAVDAAATLITGLGDHGVLWTGIALWRGRRAGPQRRAAIRALGVAGVSSSLVNAGIKQVVGRERPDRADLRISNAGVPVRAPTTSSFPSGHTLAAFSAATVLSRPGDPAGTAFLYTAAGLIGASRVHLGAHHASDVVGGAVIGTALGLAVRRLR